MHSTLLYSTPIADGDRGPYFRKPFRQDVWHNFCNPKPSKKQRKAKQIKANMEACRSLPEPAEACRSLRSPEKSLPAPVGTHREIGRCTWILTLQTDSWGRASKFLTLPSARGCVTLFQGESVIARVLATITSWPPAARESHFLTLDMWYRIPTLRG